jgi:hypothetical protein
MSTKQRPYSPYKANSPNPYQPPQHANTNGTPVPVDFGEAYWTRMETLIRMVVEQCLMARGSLPSEPSKPTPMQAAHSIVVEAPTSVAGQEPPTDPQPAPRPRRKVGPRYQVCGDDGNWQWEDA